MLYQNDTQICQTAVSFLVLPSDTAACNIGGSSLAPVVDANTTGTTYFSQQNVVVVNPVARQDAVQAVIQVERSPLLFQSELPS